MNQITVLRPDEDEALESDFALAPRGELPARPKVGLIANGKPLAKELLSVLVDGLSRRLDRELEIVLIEKASAGQQLEEERADALAEQVDVVITGLGDCGACSTCSLYDAVMLEKRGVPATVLITEPFQSLIASLAAKLGAPGYHTLSVSHPVWGKDDEQLRAVAEPILDTAVAQLTGSPS